MAGWTALADNFNTHAFARIEALDRAGADIIACIGKAGGSAALVHDEYSVAADGWVAKPAPGVTCLSFETCVTGNALYVVSLAYGANTLAIRRYDPVADAWTPLLAGPVMTVSGDTADTVVRVCVTDGTYIWAGVATGTWGGEGDVRNLRWLRYDIAANTWASQPELVIGTTGWHVEPVPDVKAAWMSTDGPVVITRVKEYIPYGGGFFRDTYTVTLWDTAATMWVPLPGVGGWWQPARCGSANLHLDGELWLTTTPRSQTAVLDGYAYCPGYATSWDSGYHGIMLRMEIDDLEASLPNKGAAFAFNDLIALSVVDVDLYHLDHVTGDFHRSEREPYAPQDLELVGGTGTPQQTYDTTPTFSWNFVDEDLYATEWELPYGSPGYGATLEAQSSYRLRVVDALLVEVYNSGKVAGAWNLAEVPDAAALAPGDYTAYVTVWDGTDRTSTEASLAFRIIPGVPGASAPTVVINAPLPLAVVAGAAVAVDTTCTAADSAIVQVRFLIDGAVVDTLGAPNNGPNGYLFSWNSFTVENGDHILSIEAQDADADVGMTQITVAVLNLPPPGITVVLIAPTDSEEVSGSYAVHASCSAYPEQLSFYVDDVLQLDMGGPNGGNWHYWWTWDTTAWADGAHVVSARLTGVADDPAGDSVLVWVNNTGGGTPPAADATPPNVSITTPLNGATVSGDVTVTAIVTDDVAVGFVKFYVDGSLRDTLTTANGGDNTYIFVWDTEPWANGEHVLRVVGIDTGGNAASAEVTVNLSNTVADIERYLFTKQLPTAEPMLADVWMMAGRYPELSMLTVDLGTVPPTAGNRYNVEVGVHVPGDTVNFEAYQRIPVDRSHGFIVQGSTLRWAFRARPVRVLAWHQIGGALEAWKLEQYEHDGGTYVAVLVRSPHAIWRFDGSDLIEIEDISSWAGTPNDIAWDGGGKLVVSYPSGLVIDDLDDNHETFALVLPDAAHQPQVLTYDATAGVIWVGCNDGGAGALYSFEYPELSLVWEHDSPITGLYAVGGYLLIGDDAGRIYLYGGSGIPALQYDTTQDAVIEFLTYGQTYAGTRAVGWAYRAPASGWAQEMQFGFTQVRALGDYREKVYAGGTSHRLWRRDGADDWVVAESLSGITAINDLLHWQPTDGTCPSLLIATTGATEGRMYRLSLSEDADIICGPLPPDFCGRILRTVNS